jgi:hypothetical protein
MAEFKAKKLLKPNKETQNQPKPPPKEKPPQRRTRDFKLLLANRDKAIWLDNHNMSPKKKIVIPKLSVTMPELENQAPAQPLESSNIIRKIIAVGMIGRGKRQVPRGLAHSFMMAGYTEGSEPATNTYRSKSTFYPSTKIANSPINREINNFAALRAKSIFQK